MNDQDVSQKEISTPLTPGTQLAQAREEQGLSLEYVSEQLKITSHFVQAIENSDFDVLPEPAFVRGYIRNYAKLVRLDDVALAAQYDELINPKKVEGTTTREVGGLQPIDLHGKSPKVLVTALVLVLGLGVGSYFLWSSLAGDSTAEPVTVESTTTVTTESTTPVEVTLQPAPASVEPQVETVAKPEPAPLVTETVAVQADQIRPKGTSDMGQISIVFNNESWFEVRNGEDVIVLSSVQKPRSVVSMEVIPPVRLRFGDIKAVESIKYNGETVEPPKSDDKVVALTLTDK